MSMTPTRTAVPRDRSLTVTGPSECLTELENSSEANSFSGVGEFGRVDVSEECGADGVAGDREGSEVVGEFEVALPWLGVGHAWAPFRVCGEGGAEGC